MQKFAELLLPTSNKNYGNIDEDL